MRDGSRFVLDERLVLRRERRLELRVRRAVDLDRKRPLVDARANGERDVERRRAELLEPEAELLDEIEREPVRAWRPRGDDRRLELDLLAGHHHLGERDAAAVPDDRVAERIEPVVGELDALAAARAPRAPCRRSPGAHERAS